MNLNFKIKQPFLDVIDDCNSEQRLKLYDAIFYYAETGQLPKMTELTRKFFVKLLERVEVKAINEVPDIIAWNNFENALSKIYNISEKLQICDEKETDVLRVKANVIINKLDERIKVYLGNIYKIYEYCRYSSTQLQIEKQQFIKFCKEYKNG